ncbi:hypothetical protein ACJ41O_006045 [Fusarium nematophilum]
MDSPLESLPPELFSPILASWSVEEISRLMQCNRRLHKSLDPYLFSLPTSASRLMRWGCVHGEKWAVKKALSYGADVTVVEISSPNSKNHKAGRFLLESGACLDVRIHTNQALALHESLFDTWDTRLIQQCIDHRVEDHIPNFQTGLDEALLRSVKCQNGFDKCKYWLGLGANPTALVGKWHWNAESPLAIAVLTRTVPLIQLLLSRTTDLHVSIPGVPPRDQRVWNDPVHPWKAVPMIAAARRMATDGDTTAMELLLQAGGDINTKAESHLEGFNTRGAEMPRTITPLHTFVLTADMDNMKFPASQGVKFFLERGAEMAPSRSPGGDLCPRMPVGVVSKLWEKFDGVQCLLNDEIYAVLKLLIRHGGAKRAVSHFLLRQTFRGSAPVPPEVYDVVVDRWRIVLDLLLDGDESFEHCLSQHIDELFFEFVLRIMSAITWSNNCYDEINDSHPVTLQKLLDKGADIRAKSKEQGKDILSVLHDTFGPGSPSSYPWFGNPKASRLARARSFMSTLVTLGARPITRHSQEGHERIYAESEKWLRALRSSVAEEKLLWMPTAGFLLEGNGDVEES